MYNEEMGFCGLPTNETLVYESETCGGMLAIKRKGKLNYSM